MESRHRRQLEDFWGTDAQDTGPAAPRLQDLMGSVGNLPGFEQVRFNSRVMHPSEEPPAPPPPPMAQYNPFLSPQVEQRPGEPADVRWFNEAAAPSQPIEPLPPPAPIRGRPKKKKKTPVAATAPPDSSESSVPGSLSSSSRSRSPSVSSSSPTPESSLNTIEERRLMQITKDTPSPPIWTIGTVVAFSIIMICELYQQGGITAFSANPMAGPSDSTMVQMGAKLASLILDGEWWRLGTALFCQNGIISLLITGIVSYFSRGLERDSGFWRACMLFIIAGLFGYIISSLFIPDALTCGSTGSILGYVGLQLCELYTTWHILMPRQRKLTLGSLGIMTAVLIIVGLTPYVDNWAHLGGLIMGILFAIMLLPNFAFRRANRVVRGILAFMAFPLMATVFMLCLVLLFRKIDSVEGWCPGCYKFNAMCLYDWCTLYHQGA